MDYLYLHYCKYDERLSRKELPKIYKDFSFSFMIHGKTEIPFCLSDIIHSNACIRFKEDGKHAYLRELKYRWGTD